MDALAFLRADHESVLGLLEALDEVPRAGEGVGLGARNDMVTTLVIAESQHEAVEEQFFWPAVRRTVEGGDELADHGVAQEDAAKRILQMLEDGEAGDPVFEEALARFVEAAREHIEFEQEQVWPRLREAMTAADLEALGEKMARAKPMAPTRPHPGHLRILLCSTLWGWLLLRWTRFVTKSAAVMPRSRRKPHRIDLPLSFRTLAVRPGLE